MKADTEWAFIFACILSGTIARIADAPRTKAYDLAATNSLVLVEDFENRTLIFYPANSRRRRPAFAAVTWNMESPYQSKASYSHSRGTNTIVGVRAKEYEVARLGEDAEDRRTP